MKKYVRTKIAWLTGLQNKDEKGVFASVEGDRYRGDRGEDTVFTPLQ